MKRKIFSIVAIGLVASTPAWCLFGEDIAYLIQIIHNGKQLYDLGRETKDTVTRAAHFVTHPNWRGALGKAQDTLGSYAQASDNMRLKRLNAELDQARDVYNELSSEAPTLESAVSISQLHIQMAQTKEEADQLQYQMDWQTRYQQYAQEEGGFGNVSASMGRLPK